MTAIVTIILLLVLLFFLCLIIKSGVTEYIAADPQHLVDVFDHCSNLSLSPPKARKGPAVNTTDGEQARSSVWVARWRRIVARGEKFWRTP